MPPGKRRPFTFADYARLPRVSNPVPSPDGRLLAFEARTLDLDADCSRTDLYVVPAAGGVARRLPGTGVSNTEPSWSPDGRRIAFISNHGGSRQVFVVPLDGGPPVQVTSEPGGAFSPVWSPDGTAILFVSRVGRPDSAKPANVRAFDDLLFRHWDNWLEGVWQHVLAVSPEGGEPRDLTPGAYHTPPLSLAGPPYFAVSPDGEELCVPSNRSAEPARTTAIELHCVSLKTGRSDTVTATAAVNACPAYSPDGRFIAFAGMNTPVYEADRRRLRILDRATREIRDVCPGFTLSVEAPAWDAAGRFLYFSAQERGRSSIWRVAAAAGDPERITTGSYDTAPRSVGSGAIVFVRQGAARPGEIYAVDPGASSPRRLTSVTEPVISDVDLRDFEEFSFEGAEGAAVQGYLLKPPGFDPKERYAGLLLVHGGPQAAWNDEFQDRWNAQIFASWGYVVVMINPRGSTGFGDLFKEQVSRDWGGRMYQDLMLGVDHVLANCPYVDSSRVAAAGASVGGYLINWIAGHTDRFRCLVTHGSIFNTESFAYSTDEHWFVEWEFGGRHWDAVPTQRRWSPHVHAGNFRTPLLVLHGEQDFRCPVTEGIQAFTAARLRGAPARMVLFKDEGHWIQKPRNRQAWYEEIRAFLARHVG